MVDAEPLHGGLLETCVKQLILRQVLFGRTAKESRYERDGKWGQEV